MNTNPSIVVNVPPDPGEAELAPSMPPTAPPPDEMTVPGVGARSRFLRRAVIALLLTVVLVPPTAAFYSYFTGVPLHLLAFAEKQEEKEAKALSSVPPSIWLVSGK